MPAADKPHRHHFVWGTHSGLSKLSGGQAHSKRSMQSCVSCTLLGSLNGRHGSRRGNVEFPLLGFGQPTDIGAVSKEISS